MSSVPLKAALHIADAAASQSGFIAGFAYYELSRQGATNAERVPLYPILLLGAFTLSVLCSGITAYLHLSVDECEPCQEKRLAAMHSRKVCFTASSLAYWCNRGAFYMYCGSMPLMGEVYNPTPHASRIRDFETFKHFVVGYHMLIILGIALALDVWFATRDACKTAPSDEEVEQTVVSQDSSEYMEDVSRSMDAMGSRALLLVGFIQHASARFVALEKPADGKLYQLYLNILFPSMVSSGCGFLQGVVYLTFMSTTQIRKQGASMSKSRRRFMTNLLRVCDIAFKFGVFCVLFGAALTGWGCSCPCSESPLFGTAVGPCAASPLPPGGICYARVAYVPLTCCITGLLVVIYFQCWSRGASSRSPGETCPLRDPADLPTALDSLGTVATLAAGFVMYNITTFDTDVIRGPLFHEGEELFGITGWGYAFLWANWVAFSLGVAATMCVQVINGNLVWIAEEECRRQYLLEVESRLRPVESITLLSLIFFVLAFGLLGLAKMRPSRSEGFVASLALLAVLATQAQKIWKYRWEAETGHKGIALDSPLTISCLQKQLNAITAPSMMFGGFAYNGISFLFRADADLAPTYVVGMAACFSCALYLTFTSTSVGFSVARLGTLEARESFAARLGDTVTQAHRSFTLYLLMFMAAFTVMGYIKLWDYGTALTEQAPLSWQYGWLQLLGGLVGIASLWSSRRSIRVQAAAVRAEGVDAALKDEQTNCMEPDGISVKKLLASARSGSSSTAFQVGNVFYEVLFSGTNLSNPLANYAYFGLSVTTLVLGSIALMIASEILFRIEELPGKLQSSLVQKLTRHFRSIRLLYIASLLSWLCSMLFSSEVKYPKLWWASFSWSVGGLVILLASWGWTSLMVRRSICKEGPDGLDSVVTTASSTESESGSCEVSESTC
mmetsp:Transcript_45537/g.106465  ORF Transcript_45537/g.106465 Transcript_45537/m.106465 type:complete len:902 (-) Transcript_45537:45-2750(-)